MLDSSSIPRISTHFYKIAHLQSVTCTIYAAKEASLDQYLLELELQIRHKFPRILLTYYSKCLYQFKFDHIAQSSEVPGAPPANTRLDDLYPQLTYKTETSTSAFSLSKPSKGSTVHATNKTENQGQDDHQAFISLTFFKAVKKMIVYNLCLNSDMRVFGNYVVSRVTDNGMKNVIVQVDPVVLENGDLVVSYFQMNRLVLWDSAVINFNIPFAEITNSFVIYVMPSGLRCHFFDVSDYESTFTHTHPKSGQKLLQLLKLSTGIDLSDKHDILWAKLVPNLQHLNNQTSNIAHFVHEVDNKKFIMWPWELCLLQFGNENIPSAENKLLKASVNPLELINRFIDSSIAANEEHLRTKTELASTNIHNAFSSGQPHAYNAPSSMSTGRSTGNGTTAEDYSIKFETPMDVDTDDQRLRLATIDVVQEKSSYPNESVQGDSSASLPHSEKTHVQENGSNEDLEESRESGDDDDLFGESSDSEAVATDPQAVAIDLDDTKQMAEDRKENAVDDKMPPFMLEEAQSDVSDEKHSGEKEDAPNGGDSPPSFVNISRDQMISNYGSDSASYEDPGAPLPIIPTPVIPQGPSFPAYNSLLPESSAPSRPPSSRQRLRPKPDRFEDVKPNAERPGFVFSPIKFNPVIKSSIDTKYGKGGKFYVAQDGAFDLDLKTRRVRETSVSSGSPLQLAREDDFTREHTTDAESVFERRDSFASRESNHHLTSALELEKFDEQVGYEHNPGDEEADDDFDDDEESDVDEDIDDHDLQTSPLRLNIMESDPFAPKVPQNPGSLIPNISHRGQDLTQNQTINSPSFENARFGDNRGDSPFGLSLKNEARIVSLSPSSTSQFDVKDVLGTIPNEPREVEMSLPPTSAASPSTTASTSIGESSNCLPLILRSINVLTIPPEFMVENFRGNWDVPTISTGFDIDVEEFEDLGSTNSNELSVRSRNLDQYLKWVSTNIVFDFGHFESRSLTRPRLPAAFDSQSTREVVESEPIDSIKQVFTSVFPLSFRMSLNELQFGFPKEIDESSGERNNVESHLEFLEEKESALLKNEEESGDHAQIYWDSIYHDLEVNKESSRSYSASLMQAERKWAHQKKDDEAFIAMTDVKAKVLNHSSEIINFDFLGLRFWRYLDLKPMHSEKNFQVLVLSETCPDMNDLNVFEGGNLSFLSSLRNNYKDNHFGDMKRLSLQTPENRPDLEGVNNGIALANCSHEEKPHGFYKKTNKTLNALAELIKFDLINKHNRFDFDRPLLLLFITFDDDIGAISQISKLCRNFEVALSSHQLSLVQIFSHVIPWRAVVKQQGNWRRLRYLSNSKLTEISMNLYNKCPESKTGTAVRKGKISSKLFTKFVKERPESLNFRIANRSLNGSKGFSVTNDIFLHVAYDRSIDRRWVCASWSDPDGVVTETKSWQSASKKGDPSSARDIGHIIGEIWETSIALLKHLNDDESRRASGKGGKKFLVFTRINSILPDDELVYWKRLTSKNKEISLIVLSANRLPKTTFTLQERVTSESALSEQSGDVPGSASNARNFSMSGMNGIDFLKVFNGVSGQFASSPNTADMSSITSPLTSAGVNLHSPRQFLNAQGNLLSPQDGSHSNALDGADDTSSYLCDRSLDLVGFIPQTSLPSSNSPTRLGMKTGYLIAEADSDDQVSSARLMVYEVSLLSCSTQLNLNSIMRVLLNQFKKLIHLNYIVGIISLASKIDVDHEQCLPKGKLRSIVPWHINAVGKTLDYLVHINVKET